jgi:hypothetical protein
MGQEREKVSCPRASGCALAKTRRIYRIVLYFYLHSLFVSAGCGHENNDCENDSEPGPVEIMHSLSYDFGSTRLYIERTGKLRLIESGFEEYHECCDSGEEETTEAIALAAEANMVNIPVMGDPECILGGFNETLIIRDYRTGDPPSETVLNCQQIEHAKTDALYGDDFSAILHAINTVSSRLIERCGF